MANRSLLVAFIGFVFFLVLSIITFHRETDYFVLYYSAECPHCVEVLNFIFEHQVKRQVFFKEVFFDEQNYQELLKVAKKTGLKKVSVPALYDPRKGRVVQGEEKVKNYLKRWIIKE